MQAGERGSNGIPRCPRCGARLLRERRLLIHRVISLFYPVRSYTCEAKCGFAGILPSRSGLRLRKRKLRLLFALLTLAVAAGILLWKYGADLTWSPVHPPANEGIEESSAEP